MNSKEGKEGRKGSTSRPTSKQLPPSSLFLAFRGDLLPPQGTLSYLYLISRPPMLFGNPLSFPLLLLLGSSLFPSLSSANNLLHSSSPSRDRRHRSLSLKHRATTANAAGGWSSLGCTQDGPSRALTGYSVDLKTGATVEAGLLVCQRKGFAMASLQ